MSACVEFDAVFDAPRIQHSPQRVPARRPREDCERKGCNPKRTMQLFPVLGIGKRGARAIAHAEGS